MIGFLSATLRLAGLGALFYVAVMLFVLQQPLLGIIVIGATLAIFLGTGFALDTGTTRRKRR